MATTNDAKAYQDHATQVRVASGINTLLGLWLIASPWVYGYSAGQIGSVWNSVIVGVLIAVFGLMRVRTPHEATAFSWINLVLGIWTVISPWIYGYAANTGRMWNNVIVGIVVFLLSIWSGSITVSEHRHAHA
ncbi:MAG TPA: SPW repeat protein [Steroidobacteraceae bacterium]|nr:SPW repeat protein [Steroidobacteraceae bacterium]